VKIHHLSDVRRPFAADDVGVLLTGSDQVDAQKAFLQASRSRRRAALGRRLRREPAVCGRLHVYDQPAIAAANAVRTVSLDRIGGTLEPSRAKLFDGDFRPRDAARERWQRIWLAEHRGAPLPPVELVKVGDGYAVADGHHRVSVARARGALAIDATIAG
jgi:hypothetical protein